MFELQRAPSNRTGHSVQLWVCVCSGPSRFYAESKTTTRGSSYRPLTTSSMTRLRWNATRTRAMATTGNCGVCTSTHRNNGGTRATCLLPSGTLTDGGGTGHISQCWDIHRLSSYLIRSICMTPLFWNFFHMLFVTPKLILIMFTSATLLLLQQLSPRSQTPPE